MYGVMYCSCSEEEEVTKLLLFLVLTHHIQVADLIFLKMFKFLEMSPVQSSVSLHKHVT